MQIQAVKITEDGKEYIEVSKEQFNIIHEVSNHNSKRVEELREELAKVNALARDHCIEKESGKGVLIGWVAGYEDDPETIEVPLKEVRRVVGLALAGLGEHYYSQPRIIWKNEGGKE